MLHDDPPLRVLPKGRHRLSRRQVRASQRGRISPPWSTSSRSTATPGRPSPRSSSAPGCRRKAFYEHFAGKEPGFLAAYDAGVEVLRRELGGVLDAPAPPAERVARAIDRYLDLVAAEPAFARTFLIEVYGAGPRALERRLAAQRAFAHAIAATLGVAGDPRARLACAALVGGVVALVTDRVGSGTGDADGLRAPVDDLVDDWLGLVVHVPRRWRARDRAPRGPDGGAARRARLAGGDRPRQRAADLGHREGGRDARSRRTCSRPSPVTGGSSGAGCGSPARSCRAGGCRGATPSSSSSASRRTARARTSSATTSTSRGGRASPRPRWPASPRARTRPAGRPARGALLRAADALHADRTIGDDLWAALRAGCSDVELIELCLLVGHYEMLAMTINSLGIQPDEPGARPPSALARLRGTPPMTRSGESSRAGACSSPVRRGGSAPRRRAACTPAARGSRSPGSSPTPSRPSPPTAAARPGGAATSPTAPRSTGRWPRPSSASAGSTSSSRTRASRRSSRSSAATRRSSSARWPSTRWASTSRSGRPGPTSRTPGGYALAVASLAAAVHLPLLGRLQRLQGRRRGAGRHAADRAALVGRPRRGRLLRRARHRHDPAGLRHPRRGAPRGRAAGGAAVGRRRRDRARGGPALAAGRRARAGSGRCCRCACWSSAGSTWWPAGSSTRRSPSPARRGLRSRPRRARPPSATPEGAEGGDPR